MNQTLLAQLSELRYAIDEALRNSARIRAAVATLEIPVRHVEIAIDVALINQGQPGTSSASAEGNSDPSGRLILNANDIRFLRVLKISV